jgi:hypothetical protein
MATFLELTDTPASFTTHRLVKVNRGASGLEWSNTILVRPEDGVNNIISGIVSGLNSDFALILEGGTFTQTEPITVKNGVTRFAIVGQGIGLTIVNFHGCNGFVQETYENEENGDYSKRAVCLSSFTMTTNGTSYKGIDFEGCRNESKIAFILKDLELRGSNSSYYWNIAIYAKCWWNFSIENCQVNPFAGGSIPGGTIGVKFLSCVSGHVVGGDYNLLDKAFVFRCADKEIQGWTYLDGQVHGCEGVKFSDVTVQESNYGIYIYQENSSGQESDERTQLSLMFENCTLDRIHINPIREVVPANNSPIRGGYHVIKGGWFAHSSSPTYGEHGILLARPGSRVVGVILTGSSSIVVNGITLGADASRSSIVGCMLRFFYAALWIMGDQNSIIGNTIENAQSQESDVILGADSSYNALIGNIMDKGISDSGSNNLKEHNVVY